MKILCLAAFLMMFAGSANALIIDTWTTNEGGSGNYILTVDDVGDTINFNLTIDPWNAEALGLFIDLGDVDITVANVGLTNISPTGEVELYATDTVSNDCGAGCTLNGLNPSLVDPDSQWEFVFRLGDSGFDGIQTFSWTINDWNGINAADSDLDILVAGIRSQQLCDEGDILPDGSCGGSDKSYGGSTSVPEPSVIALFGLGLLGLGFARRRKA